MKTHPRNRLGRALQLARSVKGVSQEDFVGVSGRTYISQLERGERHVTLNKVDELASVLGMHPATLVALSYLTEGSNTRSISELLGQIQAELALISVVTAENEHSPKVSTKFHCT